jgi:hypothetical protein
MFKLANKIALFFGVATVFHCGLAIAEPIQGTVSPSGNRKVCVINNGSGTFSCSMVGVTCNDNGTCQVAFTGGSVVNGRVSSGYSK